jgi:anaerobic magnesium-protoporphyrin IX monomethyl ester cyclase
MVIRKKVVLYNPRAVFWTLPLGLVAVGSALGPEWDVRIVDARLEQDPLRRVADEARDAVCVGMGVLTGAPIRDALAATEAVRRAAPGVPVVWGGWHPSLFPDDTVRVADAAVVGQGEVTFAELVRAYAAGASPAGIAGVVWRDAEGVHHEAARALVDVNCLPPHDYALVPVERYFAHKKRRQLDYISSIGCRFRCAFCADPEVYGRAWSGLAPSRVAAELAALHKRYGFDDVAFQDETFFTDTRRVTALAEALSGAGHPFTWTATMRADQGTRLPEDTLAACRRAGLRRVMVGVEAGTDPMLKRIAKDITVQQVRATADKLLRHGISAIWNFIVGFPDEDEETFAAALSLARELAAMSPDFEIPIFFFRPYPGSALSRDLADRYPFPTTLQGWADFDYVGATGPWVPAGRAECVDRFRFYGRLAYGRHAFPGAGSLRRLARWRVERDFYRWPLEQRLAERLRPVAGRS